MHDDARDFLRFVKTAYPQFFIDKIVHDVGSGDINGTNRELFQNCFYTGNDVTKGKNVSLVCKTKDVPFTDEYFDTIISSECFEHDPEFNDSIKNIYRMLKPGGLFAFTCASTGRAEHGTRRTSPTESFGTRGALEDFQDHYKNITFEDFNAAINVKESFSQWGSYYNSRSKDLYFWGVKNGGAPMNTLYLFKYPDTTLIAHC